MAWLDLLPVILMRLVEGEDMDRKKLVSWGVPIAILMILLGYLVGDLRWGITTAVVMTVSYALVYLTSWIMERRKNNSVV